MFKFLKKLFSNHSDEDIKDALAKKALLVDVRSLAEFSAGSVEGALNIPLNELNNQLAKFQNAELVLVFCQSGVRSSQAVAELNRLGVHQVVDGVSWKKVRSFIENGKGEKALE